MVSGRLGKVGTPRARARRWGKLVRWQTTEDGSQELRRDTLGRFTLLRITPDVVYYTENLRPSEAAMATIGWKK